MSAENARKGTPPYISPSTFRHLREQLQSDMPDRIDRSYLNTMHSGSASTQIMSALRYLELIDGNNKPTHHLRLLVDKTATPEERTKRLRDIANRGYGFVLNNGEVDTKTATYSQLEELFTDHCGVDGDVRRKCIKFFTSLAHDASITLSSHVAKRIRMTANSVPRPAVKKPGSRSPKEVVIPQQPVIVPERYILLDKLIGKFPDFDHKWTMEERKMWIESFAQVIMRLYPPETPL